MGFARHYSNVPVTMSTQTAQRALQSVRPCSIMKYKIQFALRRARTFARFDLRLVSGPRWIPKATHKEQLRYTFSLHFRDGDEGYVVNKMWLMEVCFLMVVAGVFVLQIWRKGFAKGLPVAACCCVFGKLYSGRLEMP